MKPIQQDPGSGKVRTSWEAARNPVRTSDGFKVGGALRAATVHARFPEAHVAARSAPPTLGRGPEGISEQVASQGRPINAVCYNRPRIGQGTFRILLAALALFLGFGPVRLHAAQKSEQPNIVFLLIDDMPWYGTQVPMDKSIPGSAMKFAHMPNLEKLAQAGMTFRNARAAAGMCAPSRCSVQTGMMTAHHLFSGNSGFGAATDGNVKYTESPKNTTRWLFEPQSQGNIRFPSIGDVLRKAGYATGHFGKWHIYGGGPALHGYDESDGDTTNMNGLNRDPLTGAGRQACEDPKWMFSITWRGMNFMENSVKARKPFFLQLSHYATHGAFQARPETLKKYEDNPLFAKIADSVERQTAIVQAAMLEDLDRTIGMILNKIKALGIEKNTYVVFTSDNGHIQWNEEYTHLLRGDKWWLWEMGIRVPLIVRGPGVAAGSQSSVNVVGYDFLPTFAELAGAGEHQPKAVDGASFVPVLFGKPLADEYVNRPILFHYPHYRASAPCSAMVQGEMKLLHFYEWPDEHYLCNLAEDIGEAKNLAKAEPQRAAQMYQTMMERFKAVGAYFPKPNLNVKPNAKRYNPNDPADRSREIDK